MIARSLRWRLAIAMILIVATLLIAAGIYSSLTVKYQFDRFLIEQSQANISVARTIVLAGGRAGLEESLARVHRQFRIRTIVLDEQDRVIGRYPPDLDRYQVGRLPNGGLELTYRQGGKLEAIRMLGNARPIPGIGTVYFLPGGPGRDRRAFRVSIDRWLLAGLAIAALMAVAVMLTIFRRVFEPVEELTSGARALAGGRLDARVRVRGNDEIAELGGAFNSMAEALERNERARRNMVSDVAHELRTPLTNIRVQVEAAQDGVVEPDAKFLASLEEETTTLSRLVDDLQQLSLADAGQLQLELAEVMVAEIVERALSGLPANGHAIVRDVDASLAVRADARRIVQVVRNLVVNAIAHAKSRVDVSARRAGDALEIRVADDGPGVPEGHEERVFDRFHRVDASRSRTTGGAGLGLAIAKELVELHRGTIAYERPAFVVRLPLDR